jgi:ribosomal protein S16
LVAADVRRPAAAGQLKILGEKAGVETFSGKGNSALTIAADALNYAGTRGINLLIVDTAGRLHIDQELMEELKELKSFLQPRDVLLVLDAMTGQDAVRVAVEFDRQAGIDGAILTKLDGDARGGSAISFRAVTGKPIKLIGVGEKIEDLQVFDPSRAVSRILGMGDVVSLVEKAQQVIDRDESEKLERKWRKARLDLDDFRRQLRQLEKAGGVESMLETLPVGMTGLDDPGRKKNPAHYRWQPTGSHRPGKRNQRGGGEPGFEAVQSFQQDGRQNGPDRQEEAELRRCPLAVRIRLKRVGGKNNPAYRIVVADARSPRDGRFIEKIGAHDPVRGWEHSKVDVDRLNFWLERGAQPTKGVANIIKKLKIPVKVV